MSKNIPVWGLAALIVGAGIYFGLTKPKPDGLGTDRFLPADGRNGSGPGSQLIVPENSPVVTEFVGDLAEGGTKENDGTLIPFVIGDVLTLDANALNATEYCWKVNGEVIKDDKGQEWSVRKNREFDVTKAGEHHFTLQVRGADPKIVSAAKEAKITTAPLKIKTFEPLLSESEDDRALTGSDYTMQVDMADPINADDDFYRFRYLVNDVPVKHPDDGQEWTTERDLTYTFPAPGQYSFKVQVRRTSEKEPEDEKVLASTITVADAVALTFDLTPEKYAAIGSSVSMNVFPISLFGRSECRFGVKKINEADFEWLPEENGTIWGDSIRSWLPKGPGSYIVRAEVREYGKQQVDDHREIFFTVTEGDF